MPRKILKKLVSCSLRRLFNGSGSKRKVYTEKASSQEGLPLGENAVANPWWVGEGPSSAKSDLVHRTLKSLRGAQTYRNREAREPAPASASFASQPILGVPTDADSRNNGQGALASSSYPPDSPLWRYAVMEAQSESHLRQLPNSPPDSTALMWLSTLPDPAAVWPVPHGGVQQGGEAEVAVAQTAMRWLSSLEEPSSSGRVRSNPGQDTVPSDALRWLSNLRAGTSNGGGRAGKAVHKERLRTDGLAAFAAIPASR